MSDSRLRSAIDRVVAGAASRTLLSAVDTPPRPSPREVAAILGILREVVYPGYFGEAALSRESLREHLTGGLDRVHVRLLDQVEKALALHGSPEAPARAAGIAASFLEALPGIADMVADDVRAAFDGDPAATGFDEIILAYPGVHAVFVYRLAHALHGFGVPLIPRVMTELAHVETGVDIHPGARIGRGFFIDHGTGTVIGETTDIGHNVKLYQGVTLGALSFPKNERGELIRGTKRHPTVEDDVVIYAGATILGGETVVGRGCVIGGSVWLTSSVPPGTRVTLQGDQLKREPRLVPSSPAAR